MAKRTPISKNIRFEVFKRDCFTCQYCGAKAPDVLLEVDHIKPVSKGGTNDILNLITACRDCNRGKSKKELSDDTIVAKQIKQMEDIQQRREMIQMISQWREELMLEVEEEVELINNQFRDIMGAGFSEHGKRKIRKLILEFGYNEVSEATEIAAYNYETAEEAFSKIGGICYNRKVGRKADYYNGELS